MQSTTKLSAATGRRSVGVLLPKDISRQIELYMLDARSFQGGVMGFIENCVVEFLLITDRENLPASCLKKEVSTTGEPKETLLLAKSLYRISSERYSREDMVQKIPRLDEEIWLRSKYVSLGLDVTGVGALCRAAVLWFLYRNDYGRLPECFRLDGIPQEDKSKSAAKTSVATYLPREIIEQIRNYKPSKNRIRFGILKFIEDALVDFLAVAAYAKLPESLKENYPSPSEEDTQMAILQAVRLDKVCRQNYSKHDLVEKTPVIDTTVIKVARESGFMEGYESMTSILRASVLWYLYKNDAENLPVCLKI